MTATADITLTARTSGWVEITNTSTGRGLYPATMKFLSSNSRRFDRVCFGNHGYAGASSYAIKAERVPAFIAHAAKAGLVAAFRKEG